MIHRRSFLRVSTLSLLGAAVTASAAQRASGRATAGPASTGAQTSGAAPPLLKMYKSPT